MSKPNKGIILRIVIGVVLLIVVGGVGFSIWVAQHYKKVIMDRLPGWVAKSTDSVYIITIKDLSINILTRKVTLEQVKIWPDTNQINRLKQRGDTLSAIFNVSIPVVEVSGIQWENLVSNQEIDCGRLTISHPVITILSTPVSKDSLHQKKPDTAKSKFIQQYYANRIEILHPDITYHSVSKTDSFYCFIKDGTVLLNEWKLNSNHPKDTSGFFHAKNGVINLGEIEYRKPGGVYGIKASSFDFITDKNSIQLGNLKIWPVVSKEVFYRQAGQQKEIYNLLFPTVRFANLNWKKLFTEQKILADSIALDSPSLDIYFTRLMPPNKKSKMGKYPHQLLHKLKLKVAINTIKINNGHFKYTEVNDKTQKAGTLLFDNIKGSISNITNIDSLIAIHKSCVIKLNGYFMHKSDMSATFNLLLADTTGSFSLDASLKNLEAYQINEQSKALALAEISSFHLTKMDLHVDGNQTYTKGHFTLLYNGLKIQLQKLDSNMNLKKRGFLSFIANNVFLYPDNPMPNQDVRTVDTYVPRDPLKSFFNQIWKNIYMGAQKTALRNENIVDMLKKNKGEKGKAKGLFKKLFGRKNKNK